jgi:hypothetical protein
VLTVDAVADQSNLSDGFAGHAVVQSAAGFPLIAVGNEAYSP